MLALVFVFAFTKAQEEDSNEATFKEPTTKVWLNTYGNIRISKRLFWVAETHFRFQESTELDYAGQLAQIYNRHAIGYIYNAKVNFALGGVLRLNFDTSEQGQDRNLVPEYRIWHQYQFAQPLWSAMIYHRLRIEHRWSRGFNEDSEWIYRNRWRYMFRVKIPLNTPKLMTKTLYLSPESELIMQSGEVVDGSPMEDLRVTTTLGYIITPRLTVAAGMMYNFGQDLDDPLSYKQGYTVRMHVYFSPDFRRTRDKLPEIHFRD
jgi:hypothetical protein